MNVRPYIEMMEERMQFSPVEEDSQSKLKAESEVIAKDLHVNGEECLEFLCLLYVESKEEQRFLGKNDWLDNAKTHAIKLIRAFGSVSAAKKYINRYHQIDATRPEPSRQLIHDACLFSLPSTTNWNQTVWQKIVVAEKPSGPENDVMRILSLADKIEAYIENPANLPAITQIVIDEIKKDAIIKYKEEYKNICANEKRKSEQLKENEHPKSTKKEDTYNDEYIQAIKSEDTYIAYKIIKDKEKAERLLKSTIKAKLALIIPFSEKITLLLLKKFAVKCAYDRAKENPEAATLFFEHNIPEEKFDLYLSLRPNTSHEFIPNAEINGVEIKNEYKDFVLSKINSRNPEAAILGKLTSCCQWLGGVGEPCTIHGITDPRGGFYVLRHRESNAVIAQCWAWRSEEGNLVFDSIEISLNSRTKHKDMIVDFYSHLARQLIREENIPAVIVGKGGETPRELETLNPFANSTPVNYYRYRDSKRQAIVSHRDLPFLQPGFPSINKLTMMPCHLDRSLSILWCDLAFQNQLDWELGDDIAIFELSKTEFDERTRLSQKWIDNIYKMDEPEIWETLKQIANKINLSVRDQAGYSALFYAIRQNDMNLVRFFVEELTKTDPLAINYYVNDTETAIQVAIHAGNVEILKLLHRHGARFDERILFSPHALYQLEVTQFLIEEIGIDITKIDFDGNTVLDNASNAVLEYLINHARNTNVLMQLILATPNRLIDFSQFLKQDEFVLLVREAGAQSLRRAPTSIRCRSIGIILNQLPLMHHAEFFNMLEQKQLLDISDIEELKSLLEGIENVAEQCQLLKLVGKERLQRLISRHGQLQLNYDLSTDAKILLFELLGHDCLKNLFTNTSDFINSLSYIKETSLQGQLLEIMGKEKIQKLYEDGNEELLWLMRMLEPSAQIKFFEILEKENIIRIFGSRLYEFNELLNQGDEFPVKCLEFLGSEGLYALYQNTSPKSFIYILNELRDNIQINLIRIIGPNLQKIFSNEQDVFLLESVSYKPYFIEMMSLLQLNVTQVVGIFVTNRLFDVNKKTAEFAREILEKTAQQYPEDPKIGLVYYLQGKGYNKSQQTDLWDEEITLNYFERAFDHLNLTANIESWTTNNSILGVGHENHILGLGFGYTNLAQTFLENGNKEKATVCVERAKHCYEYLKNTNTDADRLNSAIEYFKRYDLPKLHAAKQTLFQPSSQQPREESKSDKYPAKK